MREPNSYLTPPRVGLIMVAAIVFGVIFVRVIAMTGPAEVRTDSRPENGDRVTQGSGIRGLRGSLP